MPDWNPAELIGASPSPLAASLFRRLITDDVWQQARAAIGYRAVPGEPLMLLLAGRPYIDVRLSFNSLLPAGLPERIATPLVDAWLQRLHDHPALHDKVEFDVAQTVMDLSFAPTHYARYGTPLRPQDFTEYAEALRRLTNRAVTIAATGSLSRNLRIVERLGRPALRRAADGRTDLLRRAFRLLDACRRYGTRPFAVVARHAFIAEGLLRSAVEQGALRPDRLEQFRRSLTTVVRLLVRDLASVVSGTLDPRRFLRRYGHLRPGSFDVASLRYDQRLDLFCTDGHVDARPFDVHAQTFVPRRSELDVLTRLIRECRLAFSAEELIRYASAAIVGRERAKFLFSRHLSDALEYFAAWAARDGLTREDLAHLTLDDLRAAVGTRRRAERLGDLVAARRAETQELGAVRLGPLIRDVRDLYVIPPLPASPTFVTTRAVTAPLRRLHRRMPTIPDVSHRVVCIESADPGFDWIFAYRIAGLITCFGGGNSHIAIRCFELGVPAAIGVGEEFFERLTRAPLVELRCGERMVRSVWPDASA